MINLISILAAAVSLASAQEPTFRIQPYPSLDGTVNAALRSLQAQDAFAGLSACGVLDARMVRPVSLAQAEELLAPCLAELTSRYGVAVALRRAARTQDGGFSIQIEGLVLTLPSHVPVTHAAFRDLSRALSLRDNRLFGHPAWVRRATPQEESVSALQAVVDSCVRPLVLGKIATGADFIAAYGRCLRAEEALRITELRAGSGLSVNILTAAPEPQARAYTGLVTVPSEDGLVGVRVLAYGEQIALP